MEGAVDLAEEIFHMPVRLGAPQDVQGLLDIVKNPIYSTGVGLLQYGLKQHEHGLVHSVGENSSQNVLGRVRQWFQDNF
jgi:cell division protein FtsA